jgi:parallel beta-helix repeat protein
MVIQCIFRSGINSIKLLNVSNAFLIENTVFNSKENGFLISKSSEINIQNNTFVSTKYSVIQILESQNVTAVNNSIIGTGGSAISIENSNFITIINNDFENILSHPDFKEVNKIEIVINLFNTTDYLSAYNRLDELELDLNSIGERETNNIEDTSNDLDMDGIPNYWETDHKLNFLNSKDAFEDPDNDGLINLEEYLFNSSIISSDTDNDGIPDSYEYENQLNPNLDDTHLDKDGDGISNYEEYKAGFKANDILNFPPGTFNTIYLLSIIVFITIFSISGILLYDKKKKTTLVKYLGAPNYKIAEKMSKGHFMDFDTFVSAQELNINTLEEYLFYHETISLEKDEENVE